MLGTNKAAVQGVCMLGTNKAAVLGVWALTTPLTSVFPFCVYSPTVSAIPARRSPLRSA